MIAAAPTARTIRGPEAWIGASLAAALAVVAAAVIVDGAGRAGIHAALLGTARLAFLLFWPAYAGGALTLLFGARFRPLKLRGRMFGLGFAAVEAVHLAVVAWLCLAGGAPDLRTFVFFGVAAVFVYLLALFSMGPVQAWVRESRLGAACWWLLRVGGMNYIAFAFAVDFFRVPVGGGIGHAAIYWPFMALALGGPGLRLAAVLKESASFFEKKNQKTFIHK